MSNEQNPGCLGYIGDEILPNYIGTTICHHKDPVINQPGFQAGKDPGPRVFGPWLKRVGLKPPTVAIFVNQPKG